MDGPLEEDASAEADEPESATGDDGPVSLATAGFDDLRGVGFSMTQARRAIRYRDERGLSSIDELESLPGFTRSLPRRPRGSPQRLSAAPQRPPARRAMASAARSAGTSGAGASSPSASTVATTEAARAAVS